MFESVLLRYYLTLTFLNNMLGLINACLLCLLSVVPALWAFLGELWTAWMESPSVRARSPLDAVSEGRLFELEKRWREKMGQRVPMDPGPMEGFVRVEYYSDRARLNSGRWNTFRDVQACDGELGIADVIEALGLDEFNIAVVDPIRHHEISLIGTEYLSPLAVFALSCGEELIPLKFIEPFPPSDHADPGDPIPATRLKAQMIIHYFTRFKRFVRHTVRMLACFVGLLAELYSENMGYEGHEFAVYLGGLADEEAGGCPAQWALDVVAGALGCVYGCLKKYHLENLRDQWRVECEGEGSLWDDGGGVDEADGSSTVSEEEEEEEEEGMWKEYDGDGDDYSENAYTLAPHPFVQSQYKPQRVWRKPTPGPPPRASGSEGYVWRLQRAEI